MAETLDSELGERMQAVALDETLQVEPDATIGATPPAGDPANGLAKDAGNTAKQAFAASAAPHSLPRISLGAIGSHEAAEPGAQTAPDIRFLEVLGEGGMGRVHLANQNSLRREVAVKTLKEGANRHAHEALLSEARVTGFLAHPGIIPVHSLGLDKSGKPVLVMKRIEGVPWKDLIDDEDHHAWAHWDTRTGSRLEVHLQILMKICDALHFAHNQKIAHRDVKPENVMLGHFGEVYLVDWGLALPLEGKQSEHLVGTPAYMAPEMALGGQVDARTDVYLLGATLHEVLTGEYLHTGATLRELLEHAASSAPKDYDDEVPTELASLCRLSTSKDASERPASAEEFRQALADFLSHRSSIEVSNAALERLDAALVVEGDHEMGPQERAYHLGSHCAEARFGFQEALRTWQDNEAARRGLERCLELLVQAHLLRRDPVGARAQLQAMSDPAPTLLAKVEELSAELLDEQKDRERLQDIDRDLDQSTGLAARFGAFVLITVTTCIMAVGLIVTGEGDRLGNRTSVLLVSGVLLVGGSALLIKRKKLFANKFNRQLVAFAMTCMIGMLINRLLGWQLSTPIRQVLLGDLLLLSACTFICGYTITAWIKWMTPFLLAGACVLAFVPVASPPTVFSVVGLVSLLAGGLAWLVEARRQTAQNALQ